MEVLTFEENGRTKRIERILMLRCRCGTVISCPQDQDDWGWLRSDQVLQFKADHADHPVAAYLEFIEKD